MDLGTAVGLASLGLQVCQGLLDYYAAWKDFNDDMRTAYKTIARLSETLSALEQVLLRTISNDGERKLTGVAIQDCKDDLLKLDKKVKKLQSYEKPVGFRQHFTQTLQKTWYPLRQETLSKLQKTVADVQNRLNLALQVLELDTGLKSKESINEIVHKVQDINNNVARISLQNELTLSLLQLQALEKARQWLKATEQESFYQRMLDWREEKTSSWLVKSSAYLQWKNGSERHLWLYGKAGCGKTVASTSVIQDIRNHSENRKGIGYAMFYFTFDNTAQQCYRDCLASLILQISNQSSTISALLQAYTSAEKIPSSAPPDTDKLEEIFLTAIEPYAQFFLILDALDESPEQYSGHRTIRQTLLASLNDLSQKAPYLQIFATSRQLIDIQERMDMLGTRSVSMQAELVNEDIRKFVNSQLETDPRLCRFSADLKLKIGKVLIEKADGMFRWVYCQLQELKNLRCLRASYVEAILNNLPGTLDETYHRMLQQIEPQLRNDAIVLLRWMAYAKRPLTLAELSDTVLISLATEYGLVAIEDRGSVQDALDILPGLIMVVEDYGPIISDTEIGQSQVAESMATKRVKLAHFSVKEFLTSSRILDSDIKDFYLSSSIAEQFLADSCAAYLMHYASSDSKIDIDKDMVNFPLLQYAACHWNQHCQPEADSRKQFLLLQSPIMLRCWKEIYNHQYSIDFDPSQNGGLMYACFFGLNSVIRDLIDHGADVNMPSEGRFEYPLVAAAGRGHEHTVRMLVEDYNANIMAKRPWTALHAATSNGHEQTALFLLKKYRSSGQTSTAYIRDILYFACCQGLTRLIKVLLEEPDFDIDAIGEKYGNALFAASHMGHENIVRMLLNEHNANVDIQDSHGMTALMAASYYGQLSTVKILLEHHANVYLLDKDNRNCFYYTVLGPKTGQVAILDQLLATGEFDVTTKDTYHKSALDYAYEWRKVEMVDLLNRHVKDGSR